MNISEERLKELEDAETKLLALEAGGVDNWEYYDKSLESYYKKKEIEDCFDSLVEDEIYEIITENVEEPAGRGCGYGLRSEAYFLIKRCIRKFIDEHYKLKD